jgi:hypothetical protein
MNENRTGKHCRSQPAGNQNDGASASQSVPPDGLLRLTPVRLPRRLDSTSEQLGGALIDVGCQYSADLREMIFSRLYRYADAIGS